MDGTSSNDTATVWSADDKEDDCLVVQEKSTTLPITSAQESSFDFPDIPAAAGKYLPLSFTYLSVTYTIAQIRKLCEGIHILYLYSGPPREDSIEACCIEMSARCTNIDVEIDPAMDVLDQGYWDSVLADADKGKYDGHIMSPSCSTFSTARDSDFGDPSKPLPLRGEFAPGIYGLDHVKHNPQLLEKVKIGTCLALRGAELAEVASKHNQPWIAETPAVKEGKPSVTKLPQWITIRDREDTTRLEIVQCELGAPTKKATELWGTASLQGMPTACSHDKRWWTTPWNGMYNFAAHPQLRGKQWQIQSELWEVDMLRYYEPNGPYISQSSANYPILMNVELAMRIVLQAGLNRCSRTQAYSMVVTGRWSNCLVRQDMVSTKRIKLTPPDWVGNNPMNLRWIAPVKVRNGEVPHSQHIGDMRNLVDSVTMIPNHSRCGKVMYDLLSGYLAQHPQVQASCLESISKDIVQQNEVIDDATLLQLRQLVLQTFTTHGIPVLDNAAAPCTKGDISTSVCGLLLHAWGLFANDPAADVALWFRDGAPAGIAREFTELQDVMPTVEDDHAKIHYDDLVTDYGHFSNHGNLEDDDEAVNTIMGYVDAGYLHSCDTFEECVEFLGGHKPILNKFACIAKEKFDPASQTWITKRRIIMDSKRSRVKDASSRKFKSVLPRITDAVFSLLTMLENKEDHEDCEQFVIDATDAFWELGLHPEERRFFVGKVKGKFLVYLRTAQGSRGAPLSWAAVFGLICRCIQAMFCTTAVKGFSFSAKDFAVALQVYVDDPWLALRGDRQTRDRHIAMVILAWRIMGVRLAFKKAHRGFSMDWIGANISTPVCVNKDDISVVATIAKNRLDEVLVLTSHLLKSNVVSIKELRSFTGKMQSIAALLHTWRPFVCMLWAALFAVGPSNAPPGCIWSSQIIEPLTWFKAFLTHVNGTVVRTFNLNTHFNRGMKVCIYVDASPYGLGAWMIENDIAVAYFCDVISENDLKVLDLIGCKGSEGQQAFEALALLVALRLWLPDRQQHRIQVTMRGDNIAALYMVTKMQPKSKTLAIIARELAIDIACSTYCPDFAEHVSGVANVTADMLSRKHDPHKTFALPLILRKAKEDFPPKRGDTWWKCLPTSIPAR